MYGARQAHRLLMIKKDIAVPYNCYISSVSHVIFKIIMIYFLQCISIFKYHLSYKLSAVITTLTEEGCGKLTSCVRRSLVVTRYFTGVSFSLLTLFVKHTWANERCLTSRWDYSSYVTMTCKQPGKKKPVAKHLGTNNNAFRAFSNTELHVYCQDHIFSFIVETA